MYVWHVRQESSQIVSIGLNSPMETKMYTFYFLVCTLNGGNTCDVNIKNTYAVWQVCRALFTLLSHYNRAMTKMSDPFAESWWTYGQIMGSRIPIFLMTRIVLLDCTIHDIKNTENLDKLAKNTNVNRSVPVKWQTRPWGTWLGIPNFTQLPGKINVSEYFKRNVEI